MKQEDIIIDDGFFSEEECRDMIIYFNLHRDKAKLWLTSYLIEFDWRDLYIKSIGEDIERQAQQHMPGCELQWAQVVYWPHLSQMPAHNDTASEHTKFTCVINLNQDYDGGRTFFEDGTIVEPKIGQAIFFNGMKHRHGVTKVISGKRYTIAAWFK